MGESQGFVAQAVVVKEFCRREPLYAGDNLPCFAGVSSFRRELRGNAHPCPLCP